MVGGMYEPDICILLDRGFVVLLGVGIGRIGTGVGLDIRISWEAGIIRYDFLLFHHIIFCVQLSYYVLIFSLVWCSIDGWFGVGRLGWVGHGCDPIPESS